MIETEYGPFVVVEGPAGNDFIPEIICGPVPDFGGDSVMESSDPPGAWVRETYPDKGPVPPALRDYTENREVWHIRTVTGWFARWTMGGGNLDCDAWSGPFDTEEDAIASIEDDTDPEEDSTED